MLDVCPRVFSEALSIEIYIQHFQILKAYQGGTI